MALRTFLAIRPLQGVAVVGYALFFPLSQLAGGALMTAALLVTMPFLLVGYLLGALLVWATGTEAAYNVGVFLATLVQAWLLVAFWNTRERKP